MLIYYQYHSKSDNLMIPMMQTQSRQNRGYHESDVLEVYGIWMIWMVLKDSKTPSSNGGLRTQMLEELGELHAIRYRRAKSRVNYLLAQGREFLGDDPAAELLSEDAFPSRAVVELPPPPSTRCVEDPISLVSTY